MKISQLFIVACLLFSTMSATAYGRKKRSDIIDQKKNLQQLQEEVGRGKKVLDSLHKKELGISNRVSEYDQKISSDRKVIRRLNKELSSLKKKIASAENDHNSRTLTLERYRRRYLGSIRQFYVSGVRERQFYSVDPNAELAKQRQVVYLTAVSEFEQSNVEDASLLLEKAESALGELTGKKRSVGKLKKRRETSVALGKSQRRRQQKSLDQLRRKTRQESDRIMTLEKAAQEMEAIVARLEQQQRRDHSSVNSGDGTSIFAALRGQLRSPIRGKVVVKFGPSVDKVTKLKSFSPGISIEGRSGGKVRAVAAGTVAYAGELRGYGKFIIVEHDGSYYTTYASLGTITVSEGQHISRDQQIGTASRDGITKLEVRKGRDPQDPIKWLRIDSF